MEKKGLIYSVFESQVLLDFFLFFTFLIEISAVELTMWSQGHYFMILYLIYCGMWEGTRAQNVYRLLISRAVFKYFYVGLTKYVYIVWFSGHVNQCQYGWGNAKFWKIKANTKALVCP